MKFSLVLLLLAALVCTASARVGSTSSSRSLQQASCPVENCNVAAGACRYVVKIKTWICQSCVAPRIPNVAKTACVCPAGTFASSNGKCMVCSKDYYCPKATTAGEYTRKACPSNMVTLTTGAKAITACVNMPGYRYVQKANSVAAIACGSNEYSLGLKKQSVCSKCPPGFVTSPDNAPGSHTSASVCVAPPGYYTLGDTVLPCMQGEFKADYSNAARCTSCDEAWGPGLSTATEGGTNSSACNQLLPGYALVDDAARVITGAFDPATQSYTGAKLCPQKYYCPGGDPTTTTGRPQQCSDSRWTVEEGATDASACGVPPGYSWAGAGSAIAECNTGDYREGWSYETSATCLACGSNTASNTAAGWLSDPTISVIEYDKDSGSVKRQLLVRGSSESCFIQQGMGTVTVKTATGSQLKVVFCPPNFFGVSDAKKFGQVNTPCLACPPNMVTVTKANAPNVHTDTTYRAQTYLDNNALTAAVTDNYGYFNIKACVTPVGYGYAGGAAQMCADGYFASGGLTTATFANGWAECTKCPEGTTTTWDGTTKSTYTDCNMLVQGYGFDTAQVQVALCAPGSYRTSQTGAVVTSSTGVVSSGVQCTGCTDSKWTETVGSISADNCTLCAEGYGTPVAGTACTVCTAGLYGSSARNTSPCSICPADRAYTFYWDGEADIFHPLPTSRTTASNVDDCVADYSQTVDGAHLLDLKMSSLTTVSDASSLDACVETCRGQTNCVAVTFTYAVMGGTVTCQQWRITVAADFTGGGVAFKTFSSSSMAQSVSKGMGTGQYSFWYTDVANALGAFSSNSTSFSASTTASLNDCLEECNSLSLCVGVGFGALTAAADNSDATIAAITSTNTNVNSQKCVKLLATVKPYDPRRTLIKAEPDTFQNGFF